MKLPDSDAHYSHRTRYGRYVARRLKRAGYPDQSTSVIALTNQVRDIARAWEDSEDAIQDGLADRDYADDVLDDEASAVRRELAARDSDATKKPPYTQIFPKGIKYYTAATIEDEKDRYAELATRLTTHLSEGDDVLKHVPPIQAGIDLFDEGKKAVAAARQTKGLKQTDKENAVDMWEDHLEKVYGFLVTEVGRQKAEKFFPRLRRSRNTADK